jgi:hypothetical protein
VYSQNNNKKGKRKKNKTNLKNKKKDEGKPGILKDGANF